LLASEAGTGLADGRCVEGFEGIAVTVGVASAAGRARRRLGLVVVIVEDVVCEVTLLCEEIGS
jgi:hypothetical protein